ncbi:cutinase family protein [Mycobacterium botniense]|uniref:Cutinase n=1 Tax=Mycobacterium botniense TaxID=84962 RepID=A0A7I9XTC2_9MYCO|nr:cutinase family protein [Mycobacterium botniense]GFG73058.1 putative cutinase cut3 [Mycobacterium botniense]
MGLAGAALLAAGVLVVAPSAVSGGGPLAAATDCPDVEVIFARGTSEPPGVGRVGQALVDSLREQTGLNIDAYGVNYPAGRLQLGGGDGANDTISRVKSVVQTCPNTKIVLGGYSQGASVMDIVAGVPVGGITWGNALPAQYADHVVALATFGNIADRSGTPISSQSQLLGSKTIDVCNPSDPICHAGPGNQWSGHTEGYVPVYTDQAARFIAARLLAGQPHLPGDSQPQPT